MGVLRVSTTEERPQYRASNVPLEATQIRQFKGTLTLVLQQHTLYFVFFLVFGAVTYLFFSSPLCRPRSLFMLRETENNPKARRHI